MIETDTALLKTRLPLEHCLDVSICENYIYALCPGSSANPDQSNHSCIYVFDLEGNALKTYILDTTIRRFCITEKEGVLYGLTLKEELPIVLFVL
ncbi:MAG: BF3164 family lipoprotein [Bacteroidales bacterium]|nr:BF3164 family lipoprotein [Bacteroidales bacterium]